MSRRNNYTPGPSFGAVAQSDYEYHEQQRRDTEDRTRWEKEIELRERELQMKSQEIAQLKTQLDRMEQSISRIEATLSRFENQYFYPFSIK